MAFAEFSTMTNNMAPKGTLNNEVVDVFCTTRSVVQMIALNYR